MIRRPIVALVVALAAVGLFTAGVAWLFDTPRPRPGATRGERLYMTLCAPCHGEDGRGSWRATLFMIRPGDLTDRARMAQHTDQYLVDIVKHGGSPIGRPGMPGFEHVADADVAELVRYLRAISR
ncbi:MAG: cytochrome c [Candidatus Rokubacteria bacterium]|nr:cytochrome c [Candidatus Rokubacteria bacterium]